MRVHTVYQIVRCFVEFSARVVLLSSYNTRVKTRSKTNSVLRMKLIQMKRTVVVIHKMKLMSACFVMKYMGVSCMLQVWDHFRGSEIKLHSSRLSSHNQDSAGHVQYSYRSPNERNYCSLYSLLLEHIFLSTQDEVSNKQWETDLWIKRY
jgi:hypothetical protein